MCSVYTVGFHKPLTCLSLLLAACHVGEDSDIFPLIFPSHKQSSLSSLCPLPLSTPAPRHTRDTHCAAKTLRVDPNRDHVRRTSCFSFKQFFQSQVYFQLNGCLNLMQLHCGIFYRLNSMSSFHSMLKTFLLLFSALVITSSIKIWI